MELLILYACVQFYTPRASDYHLISKTVLGRQSVLKQLILNRLICTYNTQMYNVYTSEGSCIINIMSMTMNGKIYFFLGFVQCFKTFMTNSDPGCIIMGEQTTVCQKKYINSIQNCCDRELCTHLYTTSKKYNHPMIPTL